MKPTQPEQLRLAAAEAQRDHWATRSGEITERLSAELAATQAKLKQARAYHHGQCHEFLGIGRCNCFVVSVGERDAGKYDTRVRELELKLAAMTKGRDDAKQDAIEARKEAEKARVPRREFQALAERTIAGLRADNAGLLSTLRECRDALDKVADYSARRIEQIDRMNAAGTLDNSDGIHSAEWVHFGLVTRDAITRANTYLQ